MILIWKGAGILVAVIWFVSIIAGDRLARAMFGEDVSSGRCNLTGEWLAAALTLGLGLVLRWLHEPRPNPEGGPPIEASDDHSFFFIPVLVWPAIFFFIGILACYSAAAPSPAVFDLTPAAATKVKQEAAAKSMPSGWYVRIVAYWPKNDTSPRYAVSLASDIDRARDYEFKKGGIRVAILKRQVEMFRGARVDYGDEDGEVGFHVSNPNFEGEQLEKWRQNLIVENPSGIR
jgi:Fe-S cluster assembly iron-binding protein IscA